MAKGAYKIEKGYESCRIVQDYGGGSKVIFEAKGVDAEQQCRDHAAFKGYRLTNCSDHFQNGRAKAVAAIAQQIKNGRMGSLPSWLSSAKQGSTVMWRGREFTLTSLAGGPGKVIIEDEGQKYTVSGDELKPGIIR